jgi:hypothetical protein
MQVVNRHALKDSRSWPANAVYIGRGTPLGNPFVVGEHGNREECIEAFRSDVHARLDRWDPVLFTSLLGLRDDALLVCSCAPQPCHGDLIPDLAARARAALLARPFAPRRVYAGVGSRKTPVAVLQLMRRIAERLHLRGYRLRSGAAPGADSAFEAGVPADACDIYLPKRGFFGHRSPLHSPPPAAFEIGQCVHPHWEGLSPVARALMARNSQQVLGTGLDAPVDFVLAWTPCGAETEAERTRGTGGTGQAIALASRWAIPVINLARPRPLERIRELLERAA